MPERFRESATRDPFAITPDPKVYVPRAATETARKELLRSACNPAKTSALIGSPGLGKTLLLQLLAEEVPENLQTVYLPYAALPPEELCAWALGLLGLPAAADPIGSLQAYSRNLREHGSALLMLIDDAGAMPVATARWAGGLVQSSSGSVRLAIAASDNATGNRTIAAIGSNFDIVHLDDPMTESETSQYIDGRLALARVPDSIRARFDTQTVRLLHRISAGIPRRLHSAATGILQEGPIATADGRTGAPATSVAEPVDSAQILGVPAADERRVSRRRAEPEGIPVRVGLGGPPSQKGRRAEDRVELPPQTSESAAATSAEPDWSPAEESAEPESIERETSAKPSPIVANASAEPAPIEAEEADEVDDDWAPDRAFPAAPPVLRRAPPVSRRAIALGTLLVAFAAVAIPVIRSIVSEPRLIAATDRQGILREPTRGDPGPSKRERPSESMRGDLREPMHGEFEKSSAALEPGDSLAREESAETPALARVEEPPGAEPLPAEPPLAEPLGSFAVQINATPWANIEVDGIDLGATPLANIPLLGGAHAFRVKLPDGRVIDQNIEIDAERRFISFE